MSKSIPHVPPFIRIRQDIARVYLGIPKAFTLEEWRRLWLANLEAAYGPGIKAVGRELETVGIPAVREYRRVQILDEQTLESAFYDVVAEEVRQ